jgi:hypothetical protein
MASWTQTNARLQHPDHLVEDPDVVIRRLEIPEAVAGDDDGFEAVVPEGQLPGIALSERDVQPAGLVDFSGPVDQVMGSVEADDVRIAPPRDLQRMAALAAAEVQNPALLRYVQRPEEEVYFMVGDVFIFDDVSVRAQIVCIEKMAPPIGLYIAFQVVNRTQYFD